MFLKYRISIRGLLIFLRFSQSNTSTSPKEKKPDANWYNKLNPLNIHKLHFWKMTFFVILKKKNSGAHIFCGCPHRFKPRSVPQNVNVSCQSSQAGKSSFPKVHFLAELDGRQTRLFFLESRKWNASNLDLSGKNGAENPEPKKTKRTLIRLWLLNDIWYA